MISRAAISSSTILFKLRMMFTIFSSRKFLLFSSLATFYTRDSRLLITSNTLVVNIASPYFPLIFAMIGFRFSISYMILSLNARLNTRRLQHTTYHYRFVAYHFTTPLPRLDDFGFFRHYK